MDQLDDPVYSDLQPVLLNRLQPALPRIPGAESVMFAPLAVENVGSIVRFKKYSVPGPLLELLQTYGDRFKIFPNTIVERFLGESLSDDKFRASQIIVTRPHATSVDDSLSLPRKTQIILAAGRIPDNQPTHE